MKTNLVFLNVLLFVLILFFGSAVLSNIWIQIEYIKKFSLDILILIFLDFLNIFFVFSLITLKKGLASYMKRGVFEIIQSTLYYKSGIYLLIYSFCNSVIVAVQQIFFKVKLEEYGIEKFIHYFIIAIFGLILIIVSGFVRKASSIQKENELTI